MHSIKYFKRVDIYGYKKQNWGKYYIKIIIADSGSNVVHYNIVLRIEMIL